MAITPRLASERAMASSPARRRDSSLVTAKVATRLPASATREAAGSFQVDLKSVDEHPSHTSARPIARAVENRRITYLLDVMTLGPANPGRSWTGPLPS